MAKTIESVVSSVAERALFKALHDESARLKSLADQAWNAGRSDVADVIRVAGGEVSRALGVLVTGGRRAS